MAVYLKGKNKNIQANMRNGNIVANFRTNQNISSSSAVKTSKKHQKKHRFSRSLGNAIVERTPDFYDKANSGDTATHSAKVLAGNTFMTMRTTKRTAISTGNVINRVRSYYFTKKGNSERAHSIRSRIGRRQGLTLRRSTRLTMSNQSRKAINSVTRKDDMATKTTGIALKTTWATLRYRKEMWSAIKMIPRIISSAISTVIAFVTNIPAIIISVVSSLPVIIVVLVVSIVISVFSSHEYYGRVESIVENVDRLEEKYEIEMNVADILSITYALDWRKGTYDMYDTLCSYIYTTKGQNVDLETAMERVFVKHNPALNINNNDEWGVDTSVNNAGYYASIKNTNIRLYFNIYPAYQTKNVGTDRASYGSQQNIENLKNLARDSRAYNSKKYEEYLVEYSHFDFTFDETEYRAGPSEVGNTIAKNALSRLTCRYWWGAPGGAYGDGQNINSKNAKYFDCSGLVAWAHKQSGINIPRTTASEYSKMGEAISFEDLQTGDIITFSYGSGVSHVGIYIGNGKMVHALGTGEDTRGNNSKQCVKINSIQKGSYFYKCMYNCRRLY